MQSPDRMSPLELRASLGLAGVFGLRMLGMFIILPVFVLYARELPGGNNQAVIGIALGAYGLAQASFQLLFGRLSDRWGRKRAIYLGLLIFAVGSVVAAVAGNIYLVAVGRAIQGAGAISAALIALTADLTHEDNRTKSMAIIGMTIGTTFIVSMVAGPVLSGLFGVPGIFALTGVMALAAMLVIRFIVPDPPDIAAGDRAQAPSTVMHVLLDRQLARLNFGIFALHGVLMAMFVVIPVELVGQLAQAEHWKMYLGVMLASVAIMVPVMLVSERRGQQKGAFLGSVAVIGASALLLEAGSSVLQLMAGGLVLFFAAFNLLEAMLPSLVSRVAPSDSKGTAIGVYSTLQFLGTFVGATAGGWMAQHFGNISVFGLCAIVAGLWLVVASGMQIPQRPPGQPATSA